MTLTDKHAGIAAGLAAGGSNLKLAAQFGVSHGMIQKHRARSEIGPTYGRDENDPFIEPYFYLRENAEYLQDELDLRECRIAIYEFFRDNEMICRNCRVTTNLWVCPACGANALLENESEKAAIIRDMCRCECGLFSWTGVCPSHGPLPHRAAHRGEFRLKPE